MKPATRALLALAPLIVAATAPDKGKPELTEQTQRSGGPIDPDQAKLAFDHADLVFEVFPQREAISGVATITFTARAALDRLVVDLDRNLPISAIAIDGKPLPRSAWSNPQGRLTVSLPTPVAMGKRVIARIAYAGTPHVALNPPWDDGMVWDKTPEGEPWIASTTQGYGCDMLWPCLDFPTGEPARVDLHITVPKGLKAPSNGVLKGVETLPDGRTTWHWSARQPNSYAISLNIAPYEEISGRYASRFGNSYPLYLWHLPGKAKDARGLFEEFAPTLDFYETMIGPYPFADEKLGVVETPHLGMEHQTINAYGNGYKKAPEGFDWLFHHELAHEWFGNQMTSADWDDYWLHEGYAQYMQPLYGRWREGDARYIVMMNEQRGQILNIRPLVAGTSRTQDEVYEPQLGGPGQDIYYKGAWTLHTLRWLIGDNAFWDVTRRLVYGRPDPKPGNFTPRYASTAEYRALVDAATGRDLGWFFDVYLNEAALPDLVDTREGDQLTLEWQAPNGRPFPMPIEVEVDGRVQHVEMNDGSAVLNVPAAAHVVIDPMARVLRRDLALEAVRAAAERP